MPCSTNNINDAGKYNWELIWKAFSTPTNSIDDFLQKIRTYNKNVHNLNGLQAYLNTHDNPEHFISDTIPAIAKIALLMNVLFGEPLCFLLESENKSVSVTKYQVACLVANAFICTFPNRDKNVTIGNLSLGNFNLTNLFALNSDSSSLKIQCIVAYLEHIIDQVPDGIITITRHSNIGAVESWIGDNTPIIRDVGFTTKTPMQETLDGLTIIDFANCLVGGGFIGHGLLQEETLFACFPELLIARLIAPKLNSFEVVSVTGIQKYSIIKTSPNSPTSRTDPPAFHQIES